MHHNTWSLLSLATQMDKETRWWNKLRYRWALIGSLLSVVGPLGEYSFLAMVAQPDAPQVLLTYLYTEILTLVSFTLFGYLLGRKAELIEYQSLHDHLTGLYNRSYLMTQFKENISLHLRYSQPFSAIMLDLDYFKQVNDQHGHLVGDKTLVATADCIKKTIRSSDIAGRYGGEEFIILCPNTDSSDVSHLAERIRQNIASLDEKAIGFAGVQTASLGILTLDAKNNADLNTVLLKLDNALYQAKNLGRNQVQKAATLPE